MVWWKQLGGLRGCESCTQVAHCDDVFDAPNEFRALLFAQLWKGSGATRTWPCHLTTIVIRSDSKINHKTDAPFGKNRVHLRGKAAVEGRASWVQLVLSCTVSNGSAFARTFGPGCSWELSVVLNRSLVNFKSLCRFSLNPLNNIIFVFVIYLFILNERPFPPPR